MHRILQTSYTKDTFGVTQIVHIAVAGYRIDIDVSGDAENAGSGVCIANTEKDGSDAGWCACAYDPNLPDADMVYLTLDGTETE